MWKNLAFLFLFYLKQLAWNYFCISVRLHIVNNYFCRMGFIGEVGVHLGGFWMYSHPVQGVPHFSPSDYWRWAQALLQSCTDKWVWIMMADSPKTINTFLSWEISHTAHCFNFEPHSSASSYFIALHCVEPCCVKSEWIVVDIHIKLDEIGVCCSWIWNRPQSRLP